jgi:Nucleotidyl transferase AbiEii toxin, Type IV TA system
MTERIHDSDTFCRIVIRSADSGVLVDLAVNAPPDLPASATPAGPTLAPEELAGNKLLALFDRAAARDFADIYVLARRFGKEVLRRTKGTCLPVVSLCGAMASCCLGACRS